MWLILRYVILDLQDRVLPNLELSRKEDKYTLKIKQKNPIPKESGFFVLYAPVAQLAEASDLNPVQVSVRIRWGVQKRRCSYRTLKKAKWLWPSGVMAATLI